MKLWISGLLLFAALPAAELTIQPDAQNLFSLEIEKTGLLGGKKHQIVWGKYRGSLQYDEAAPLQSKVELTVEAASFEIKDTWVSDGQRKDIAKFTAKDMLAVEQNPEIRFRSESIVQTSGGFDVKGTLTVRGIAKPVTVQVKPFGKRDGGFEVDGTCRFKITDFGLKPPKAALGAIGTKDEMLLTFRLLAK